MGRQRRRNNAPTRTATARTTGCHPAQLWTELPVWLPTARNAGAVTTAGHIVQG